MLSSFIHINMKFKRPTGDWRESKESYIATSGANWFSKIATIQKKNKRQEVWLTDMDKKSFLWEKKKSKQECIKISKFSWNKSDSEKKIGSLLFNAVDPLQKWVYQVNENKNKEQRLVSIESSSKYIMLQNIYASINFSLDGIYFVNLIRIYILSTFICYKNQIFPIRVYPI